MGTLVATDLGRNTITAEFTPASLAESAFPHSVTRLEVRETPVSWVILTGSFAYKIKKAVKLDFLDASTLARRRYLCAEELRLNRRLAADLYLDVVAITRETDGVRVGGGSGEVIEYAVRMKQFEPSQELVALLERGEVSHHEFVDLARRLAHFHDTAPKAPIDEEFSHTADLQRAVLGNLAILLSHLDADTTLPEMAFLIDWTHDYLHDSLAQLRVREQGGAIRECHGDLHAHNIARWCARLVPFDCLEFDPKLRWIDVMNDVAFLVMDLTARGRKDLAFVFLNAYLECTGDYAGVRHLSFYSVYRALVRAMVDSLGASEDSAHRHEFQNRLRMRVKAAATYVDRSAPTLFIMHGLSGSGKSWLSERLVPQLGAVRIRSDVERKRAEGLPTSRVHDIGPEEGLYTPKINRRTYAHLLECTQSCLKGGVDTLVDAAFLSGENRRSFRDLALREGCRFIILACEADPVVLTRRIEKRRRLGVDPSDASVEVLDRQLQTREPLKADEQSDVIVVDTTEVHSVQNAFAAIQDRLESTITEPPT
jgi:hypothetical protein